MKTSLERLRQRREGTGEEGGFTLIELLIVVVILGILAAIVVFAVDGVTGSSAQSACKSDWKTVETATEAYFAQVGTYPGSVAALGAPTQGADGQQVGPWINKSDLNAQGLLINGNHYQIETSGGVVGVYTTATPPAQIPSGNPTNTAADCSTV